MEVKPLPYMHFDNDSAREKVIARREVDFRGRTGGEEIQEKPRAMGTPHLDLLWKCEGEPGGDGEEQKTYRTTDFMGAGGVLTSPFLCVCRGELGLPYSGALLAHSGNPGMSIVSPNGGSDVTPNTTGMYVGPGDEVVCGDDTGTGSCSWGVHRVWNCDYTPVRGVCRWGLGRTPYATPRRWYQPDRPSGGPNW